MEASVPHAGVFISYRRRDTEFPAGWLYERLATHFGREQIFKDVDSIQPGEDFVEAISQALTGCHTMLVVIGANWLDLRDNGTRRSIDSETDFVRLEVEGALGAGIRVIPVLIGAVPMPTAGELPASIVTLSRRNAIRLSPNHFEEDVQKLIPVIERARQDAERRDAEAAQRARREAKQQAAEAARRSAYQQRLEQERQRTEEERRRLDALQREATVGPKATDPRRGQPSTAVPQRPRTTSLTSTWPTRSDDLDTIAEGRRAVTLRSHGLRRAWMALASIVGLVAVVALVINLPSGSNGAGSGSNATGGAGASCGTVNLAVNPWVGYEADAAVYSYVAKTDLNCNVVKKDLKEQVSWTGFSTGEVDLILENWGHDDLAKQYITDQKAAVDLGPSGNKGVIGWYVPPWLAAAHPEITDWKNLNKYADQFKTSESVGQGQLLDGDPSYVTNDMALVKNLGLNFRVVQGGSETALIQSFRQSEAQHQFFLAYFYEPHWFFQELKIVRVTLPAYTPGCDADPAKIACDYPTYNLNKVASAKFMSSGSPAAELAKKFSWTNDDQDAVARSIAVDKLSDDDAAKRWVDANPDKVHAWLS